MANASTDTNTPSFLPHQAFLVRASDPASGGELALGAFLTMRMVDQFRASARPNLEALGYQVRATINLVDGLSSESSEVTHLRHIARVGEQVMKKNESRLLWAPMLGYAFWLEKALRFDESIDVLDTALGLGTTPESGDHVNAWLQRGRVLRAASRYDESTESYVTGGEIAIRIGDGHSNRRSQIGRAVVMQKLGNLADAEGALRSAIAAAQLNDDREAEAVAHHELANTLELMGREAEGVLEVYRAYELYEQPERRISALQVVGVFMTLLGNYKAADDAFSVVMASKPSLELAQNTMLELLHLASRSGDRVAFERWRRELEKQRASLPPDAYVDLEIKLGQGFTTFGQPERAAEVLESAVRRAAQYRLSKYLARAQEALSEASGAAGTKRENARRANDAHFPEVAKVAEKLHLLRSAA